MGCKKGSEGYEKEGYEKSTSSLVLRFILSKGQGSRGNRHLKCLFPDRGRKGETQVS